MDLVNEPLSHEQGNGYNVFLSFSRRKETEESFPSRLYSSLCKAGTSAFKDEISSKLLRSIRGRRIFIIFFSKDYASSSMCLEELTKIMKFRMPYDHIILPIFCEVDQFEVCNQKSGFGEAFQGLIQKFSPTENEVSRWRRALNEAGGRNDWFHVANDLYSVDVEFLIQDITQHVCDLWDDIYDKLLDVQFPVGVDSRAQDVITMLHNNKSKHVVFIGIWGMTGIGKTTIAKAIFNHIQCAFESTCFLPNVREQLERKVDLVSVICEATDMRINSIESRSLDLNERHCHKKVLLVLDDVDDLEQLNTLCGSREQFGEGSIIIITTSDLHLLNAFQVDDIYCMKLLSNQESLQLLSWRAFQQAYPKEEFIDACKEVVAYAEGLPLALITDIYSILDEEKLDEWESTLWNMNRALHPDMYNKLRLSFDCLNAKEKEIFLNIVLLYIGGDIDDVIQKLDAHGSNARIGIGVLEDRGLLTIDNNNKLRVHNLLQLMGRQIIHETSRNELENRAYRYEVFLSFRGDTRKNFTSHLYTALYNAGITVFKDDVELPRGNYIKKEVLQAIGSSKIAIIIFSSEYAGSKWCLEELSMIMELHRTIKKVVLPLFYHVDPSEIRHQNFNFGKAFEDLIQKSSLSKYQVLDWKKALTNAGSLAGTVVLSSRDESEYVKDVVRQVCDILDKKHLFVAEHPVGVDNRVEKVITMLQNHLFKDVVMIGIWGMGGSGKTTIAKAIYNKIGHTFESRSYLSNIREVWGQEEGKVCLQNQLLSEICKTTQMKINNIEYGKVTLRYRLCHKKALVVLDDVDELDQLNALVGSCDSFAQGSRIIITTRNKRLLRKMGCLVYSMENLDDKESIELFSWHAFKQKSPKEDFIELSKKIVAYSGRLPLALEVLGSYLFNSDDAEEWNEVLEKLVEIPNDKIQKKLKISFDDLDGLEKKIFLDICCFFIGMDRNEVTKILNGCKFFAEIGIKTLVERSLVTIDEKNKLGMHDLLRDMGREIIREQSQDELGKRSRLWFHEDALAVLLKHKGTKAIEGLSLMSKVGTMHSFQTKAFEKMKRLRLLRLDNVQLRGDYEYISKDLKWLCWHHLPMKYIPSNLYQEDLVVIDLQHSSLRQVWKESQLLESLKILNLSHSPHLVQTPDFLKLPNLEELILKDCPSLDTIHHSIGLHHKLLLLNLENCIGLRSLPRNIYRLKCLKTLILSGCKNIEKLEEDIEQMESLTILVAPTLKQVPYSLVRLRSILYLSVCGHEGLSNHVIPSLYRSWMSPTNNPLPLIPSRAGMPSSILWDMLYSIHSPSTIPSTVPKQQSLLLEDGLEISDSLCATNCMDISILKNCLEHLLINIGKNPQVFCTLSKKISQNLTKYGDDCILPGDNYPYWLTFKDEGTFVKFKATALLYTEDELKSLKEEKMKEIISNLEPDDQVEVKAVFGNGFTVKKTAVYLMYCESIDKQMEPSTSEAVNLTGTKHNCEEEYEACESTRPRKAMKI
ncbi:putative disease resistance protein At4g11170 [Neltuma alba]|uniref:putative disease resistance protein At4g11170 n=1 Tax=Neltuma alba TaxID=207710 RepID=UPI0010A37350|nr:putative disease resistance protein At4g11170 [Prosopis alba]